MEQPPSHTVVGLIVAHAIFFYTIFFIISRRFIGQRKRFPPEAAGAWPVIGHLHHLNANEPTHITLARMADANGPMFTLRFGMKKSLIVSNWEIAKEFLITNDRIFASRPKLVASKLLGYDYAMMGPSPYTPHWRYARKIATLELLTNHRLDQLQHIRALEVKSWMKELYDSCLKISGSKQNMEMKKKLADVTMNIIFKIVIGKRFSDLEDFSDQIFQKALIQFFGLFGIFLPADSFPFLSWLDLGGHEKEMKKTAKIIDQVLDKFLKQHREKRNNNGGEVEIEEQDFMDVMISIVKDDERQHFSYDDDTVIKAICLNIIIAGFDTTTIAMTWAISLLLNNVETLKKAQAELDNQVGRERQVKECDVKNLPYIQAIVKETLRLYPPAPLLAPHESIEDCTVVGYDIPKGTQLIVNVQKLQKDPLIWADPCEFRPERFLTSQKDFDVRGQSPQLIPFGNGRRMCPGISFAFQIMHLTLANFLHGFEIDRPSDELVDMEESAGLTNLMKAPLQVVLTPRLPPQVFE